ncbi:MAG: FHA domain-containing protein [Verrucomicrobiaceae bacterium]|nr:FHA domain-containing protein [Verrucomicrobiaceae bacterium]
MATPTIIFEDGQEMEFSGAERLTVGRAEDNNVIVDDGEMSRHHAEIIAHADGTAEVRDRGSRTGTFVNDQRVDSQILRDGDRLSFGPLNAVFRFKKTAASPVTTRIPLRNDTALREAQAALEALDARHAAKAAELDRLTAESEKATAKLTQLTTDAAKAQAKLDQLKSEASKVQASFDLLASATAKAQSRLDQLTSDALSAQTKLDQLTKVHSEEEKRLQQTRETTTKENARLDTLRQQLTDSDAQLRERQATIKQHEGQIRISQETLTRLQDTTVKTEQAIAALSTQHEQKAVSLARITSEAEEAQKLLDALSKQKAEDAAQAEAVRRELNEARSESARLRDQARIAEESLSMLQAAAAKSEAWQKERQTALDAISSQHDQKTTDLQAVQKRLDELLTRENEAKNRLRDLDAQTSQKRKDLTASLAGLESDVAAKKAELSEIHQTLKAAEASREEQGRIENTLRDLNRQLTTAEEQLTSTRRMLEEEKAELSDVRSQLAATQSELIGEKQQSETHTIKPKTSRTTITLRLFLMLVPFAVLGLASWAAEQSRQMRAMRGEGVVAMLTDPKPAMHPYAPRTEAERQIIDLVHEPLMRVGGDGTLQPALAELWRWSQDVTCWFADEKTAKQAQERLQAQIGESNRWAEWRLSAVRLVANSLVLNFNDATHANTPKALEVIGDLQPQTVAFWRIECQQPLKELAASFFNSSPLAKQIRRVWFDRENVFEIVTVGPAQRLLDEFRSHLAAKVPTEVRISLMGEVSALSEPVLDLDMRQGQTWHDGTPVTAWDVKTTIEQVSRRPWLLPNREALRHIQDMEIQNGGNQLRVVFRSRYGPALCGWAGLPVLPASWWKAHEQDDDKVFSLSPPPGAGSFRLTHLDARTLSLTPVSTQEESPRFLFHFNASPLMTEVGLGTKTTNLVWPATIAGNHDDLLACLTPPHRRLVVLWNTKSPVLADVRTREALATITDVASITAALPGKHTISDGSLFPPGMWLHTKAPRVSWNSGKAKRVLAEAGWLPGVDGIGRNAGHKFEFSLLLVAGDPVVSQTAHQLAAQWRELGANIRVETLASADLLAGRLASREFDAVMLEQRFEVSWDQFPWWHSSQAKPGGTNFAGIEDPQTDLLLEALATEFEPAAAGERVRQLEGRLLPLQAMLPLFHTVDHAAVNATLAANKPRTSWTLRELAFKPKTPSRTPSSLELKLPDE